MKSETLLAINPAEVFTKALREWFPKITQSWFDPEGEGTDTKDYNRFRQFYFEDYDISIGEILGRIKTIKAVESFDFCGAEELQERLGLENYSFLVVYSGDTLHRQVDIGNYLTMAIRSYYKEWLRAEQKELEEIE